MTLDEAIKHAKEVASEKRYEYQECIAVHDIESAEECGRCGEQHEHLAEWLKDYKRLLEQHPSDTVSRGAYEQVMWERDVAIGQLKELGYGLGQKVEPCDDAISREVPRYWIDKDNKIYKMPDGIPTKYGKWIDYRDDGFVECPFCGHATNCEDDIDELHYCFYCGARMIDPQESEVRE